MARPRVIVRYTTGHDTSSSSLGTREHVLPFSDGDGTNVTQIVSTPTGVLFRPDLDSDELDGDVTDGIVLARINSSKVSLVVEPLVDNCFVELPPMTRFALSANPDRIVMPASSEGTHHYIHVRPGDVLNFSEYGLKFSIVMEFQSSSPQDPETCTAEAANKAIGEETRLFEGDDDVQVKSSNVDSEDDDDDDQTDYGDEDVPEADFTPATSRPATEPAIKETPNAKRAGASSFADDDDAAPFSTAQHGNANDVEDSPSIRVDKNRGGETDATSKSDHEYQTSESPVQAFADAFTQVKKMKFTYGRRSSQSIPRDHSPEKDKFPQIESKSESRDVASLDDDDLDDGPINLPTSDPLDSKDVSEEVVKRSVKRKAESLVEDSDTEDDEESIVVSKKRKIVSQLEIQSDATLVGDSPAVTSRRGRPKSSRPSLGDIVNEADISAHTIRNSSQQVLVNRKRDETPTSTSTSFGGPGKTPKVLLSKDSSLRNSSSKWIKDQGSEVLDDVKTRRTNFVCVVKNDNLKTAKVLRSLVLGKLVVTEEWLKESKNADLLLDPHDYIHPDVKDSINADRQRLFNGHNLFFTATLADKVYMSGWDDIVNIAKEAGASSVHKGNSGEFAALLGRNAIICFGADNSDPDVHRLQSQHGRAVYRKSLISHAIIAGELDLDDDEFHLPVGNVRKQR